MPTILHSIPDWTLPDPLTKDKRALADNASRLLEDPLLQHSIEAIRRSYMRSWEKTERNDTAKRELIYLQHAALADIDRALRLHINNLKLYEHQERMSAPSIETQF